MPVYRYKALDATGRIIDGALEAEHLDDLEARLQRQRLELVRARRGLSLDAVRRRRRIGRRDLIDLTLSLQQLLASGVPLLEALADVRESLGSGVFRELLTELIDHIESGKTLSEAMAEYPAVFSPGYLSLVRAGEESGEMPKVLEELAAALRWQDEMIGQARKALSYPLFVAVVLIGVIFFLMTYLVPQLVGFLSSMGQEIPAYTRALIAVSDFFVAHWAWLLATPLGAALILHLAVRHSPGARRRYHRVTLKLPVLGSLLQKIQLARFLNNFALMGGAGIPALDALKIATRGVDNLLVREQLEAMSEDIVSGKGLYPAFSASGLFPPMVLRMVKVGESTGDLDGALQNAIYFYKRDIAEAIARMQSLVEPAMTVVLGLLLGWVMLSVMGPIYDLVSKIRI